MSRLDPRRLAYPGKEPIEDKFVPATKKQEDYILALAADLTYTENQRDIHISTIIGKTFKWNDDKLSREAASRVIGKFIAWRNVVRS